MQEMTLLPAARRIAERREMPEPEGDLIYGLRVVRADFTSTHGFRWPFPGQWAMASGPIRDHGSPCPEVVGDGLCVGLTWYGMASGGLSADVVLLVAAQQEDVLGRDDDKLRARSVYVIDALTVAALLLERTGDELLDLRGANLRGVNLRGAVLRGAVLRGAVLRGANLRGADLRGADLRRADLRGADLGGADLTGADLRRADLTGADLAVFTGADLLGAVFT